MYSIDSGILLKRNGMPKPGVSNPSLSAIKFNQIDIMGIIGPTKRLLFFSQQLPRVERPHRVAYSCMKWRYQPALSPALRFSLRVADCTNGDLLCQVCQARFHGSAECSRCGSGPNAQMLQAAHAPVLHTTARRSIRLGNCLLPWPPLTQRSDSTLRQEAAFSDLPASRRPTRFPASHRRQFEPTLRSDLIYHKDPDIVCATKRQ